MGIILKVFKNENQCSKINHIADPTPTSSSSSWWCSWFYCGIDSGQYGFHFEGNQYNALCDGPCIRCWQQGRAGWWCLSWYVVNFTYHCILFFETFKIISTLTYVSLIIHINEQEDRFKEESLMMVMEDQDNGVGADIWSISHSIVFLFSRPLKLYPYWRMCLLDITSVSRRTGSRRSPWGWSWSSPVIQKMKHPKEAHI